MIGGDIVGADPDAVIEHVAVDSRRVRSGSLFVALPGARTHGRMFATHAVSRGAVAVLAEPPEIPGVPQWIHARPLDALGLLGNWALRQAGATVVGVTGSVGKTSTKTLIASVLSQRFVVMASPGNYNTQIGLPLALLDLEPGVEWFVAEMAMRGPGEIRALTRIAPPTIAVVTNVGTAHLGQLGSIEAIAEAKSEILDGLMAKGIAVLNHADHRVREMAGRVRGQVLWYGDSQSPVFVENVTPVPGAVHFRLHLGSCDYPVQLPWDGGHQAMNAAAAGAVGLALGMPPENIVHGLQSVRADGTHFRRLSFGGLTVLDDTYNAGPASMCAGLNVLARETGRRIAVLGDMLELGNLEVASHREMGHVAAQSADLVLTVGERGQHIAESAQASGVKVQAFSDRHTCYRWLRDHLRDGDVIYVKASRLMQLDLLVQALQAWGGPRP